MITMVMCFQSSDVIDMQMSTKPITFQRARSGWFFRQDKSVSGLRFLCFSAMFRCTKLVWIGLEMTITSCIVIVIGKENRNERL